ncbi:hypothetical protein H4687_001351 [Streptomyces stelliscabiei]|uniref:GNAT family N-acetyltransferase n=1 Tax=Streptomyces stelliscabiei TaxID=146820 RepID=A0A8I0TPD4_9ACTN|nr:hypothetical protein [Streptomyces stelliscabiei]
MSPDNSHLDHDVHDWQVTHDGDAFLARAGDFLRSRPAAHTVQLTVTETSRTEGADAYCGGAPVLGRQEAAGEGRATFFRMPPHRRSLTPFTSEEADALAARLAGLGHPLPGVSADDVTAAALCPGLAAPHRRGTRPARTAPGPPARPWSW